MKMDKVIFLLIPVLFLFFGCPTSVNYNNSSSSSGNSSSSSYVYSQTGFVHYVKTNGNFVLYRNNQPYFIKGACYGTNMAKAAADGANSIRTWATSTNDPTLDLASNNNLSVMLGVWFSQDASVYASGSWFTDWIPSLMQGLLDKFKNHSALLMWGVGNELDLGANTPQTWMFVNQVAHMIHQQDTNHPVATVISCGSLMTTLSNIITYAPEIDIVGINAYGGIFGTFDNLQNLPFKGPIIISEWGNDGAWELGNTSWGEPIEKSSTERANDYLVRYQLILSNTNRCMGSYAFYWGQGQFLSPTWFSMFAETANLLSEMNGESYPSVDAMIYNWTGNWPVNRAPAVTNMTLNGLKAESSIILTNGIDYTVAVSASDPENDTLTYVWETLFEPTSEEIVSNPQPRPARYGTVITSSTNSITINVNTNADMRIFVYVKDGNGHAGTANIPFQVIN